MFNGTLPSSFHVIYDTLYIYVINTYSFYPPPSHAMIHTSFECLLNRLQLGINVAFCFATPWPSALLCTWHPGCGHPGCGHSEWSCFVNFLGTLKFLRHENITVILFWGVFLLWLIGFDQQFKDIAFLISGLPCI